MIAANDFSDRIPAVLANVLDPEIGRSVVDIGLIYSAEMLEDDRLLVRMTTTTRGCPAAGFLVDAVRERALSEGLAKTVDVELTYDPPWSPSMMLA